MERCTDNPKRGCQTNWTFCTDGMLMRALPSDGDYGKFCN